MKQWLLELMGQIQFLLRNECSMYTFDFMFEIFAQTILSMSGFTSEKANLDILPFAMYHFLAKDQYMEIGPTMSEWMLEIMKKNTKFSSEHHILIRDSYLAIKTCEGYFECSVWGRLVMDSL